MRAATRFFTSAITAHDNPVEVTTDMARALARTIRELVPAARHALGVGDGRSCRGSCAVLAGSSDPNTARSDVAVAFLVLLEREIDSSPTELLGMHGRQADSFVAASTASGRRPGTELHAGSAELQRPVPGVLVTTLVTY
jgi:hypothetical protein